MWRVLESGEVTKKAPKLPLQILKKYELWKSIIYRHGPEKLREFPGFRDEALKGNRKGQRSSRLNIQYRVIYEVEKEMVTVLVLEITPHDY